MQGLKRNSPAAVIDLERIHSLKRGSNELIIDRINGKWVMLPKGISALLPLIDLDYEDLINERLKTNVRQLKQILARHGIGCSNPLPPNSLNTVILKLTKACNLGCSYCYDFEKQDKAHHQPIETTLSAMYQAIDMAQQKINFILHGGEPMLVWEFIEEFVLKGYQYGKEKGIAVYFIGQTNLTRLTNRKVTFSMMYDIRWGVSIDGPPELNDQFRIRHNGEGSHEIMLDAIKEYPDFIKRCNAMSTITSANESCLLIIARYIKQLGFAGWDWTLFQAIGRGRESKIFDYNINTLIKSWDELFEEVLKGRFDGFVIEPILKYLRNFVNGPVSNMCMRSKCGAGRDLLSVSFDGTVEACDCIDPCGPMSKLGNVEAGLEEAYHSAKADYIRSREVETLKCGSCLWQAVCGGTCMARAGGIAQISEDECKLSMHIFDRISYSLSKTDKLIKYKISCE